MPRKLHDYAVYRGDELVTVGTVPELAEELNVKPQTIRFLASPAHFKRNKGGCMTVHKSEDEDGIS